MRIVVIGTGYVGLVSGTCFAELGHEVVCVDKDAAKIAALEKGHIPIYEPGLEALVVRNSQQGRLSFQQQLSRAVDKADAIFIAVGTPTNPDTGAADLRYIDQVIDELKQCLTHSCVIVTKSTVPVGTGAYIKQRLENSPLKGMCDIVSNPEFLREGSAVNDFLWPDRVIIGVDSSRAEKTMHSLYQKLIDRDVPVLFTSIETAELTKYASNAFLATKIAFVNEIATLCEQTGADITELAKGMGLDHRIGKPYLMPGPGYGGSCFPKDTSALVHIAKEHHSSVDIVEAVIASNDRRKEAMATKIIEACDGSVQGKTISILGLAFKANTDDMRESASLVIIPKLLDAGAILQVYDPEAMETAKIELGTPDNIHWCNSAAGTAKHADAIVILTEWDIFKSLDLHHIKSSMRGNILIDLRNIVDENTAQDAGFDYIPIGKKAAKKKIILSA